MKSWSGNKARFAFVFLLFTCFAAPNASAQTLTEVTPLSFGEIVIPSFASVARVTINPSGGFSVNSNVYLMTNPQRGEYLVTGPANSAYDIVLPASIILQAGIIYFTMDNIAATPGPPYMTDAGGNDTIFISGRLQSQGGGVIYTDSTYNGTLPITLMF